MIEARSRAAATESGAKARDYWWTVLVVDPLAVPLTKLLASRRWLRADQVTLLSAFPGIAMGVAFASSTRAGLVLGALLFYVSFLLDCVDGKLARALDTISPKGKVLDALADGARRASGSLGLGAYLWGQGEEAAVWWAFLYGIIAFYFAVISGGTRGEPSSRLGSKWSRTLARWRLLPTPGTPDVAAIVFFFGPLTGFVVPALVVGCIMLAAATLLLAWRTVRR